MIKVVGVWELGWTAPVSEHPLWDFPLRSFAVDEWYMTPVSGIDKRVSEVGSVDEALELNPTLTPIYIDENGTEDLLSFDHPDDAIYILGKAGYSPWAAGSKQGRSLKIETIIGGGMMWPHQCIPIVLYDRMVKS